MAHAAGDWDSGHPNNSLFYDNLFALGALGDDFNFPGDALGPADHAAASQAIPEVNHQFLQARAAANDPTCTKRFLDSEEDLDDDEVKDANSAERPSRRQKTERTAAADKKADREKARRGKMNEKYIELAKLVDPDSEPKSDKTSILCDAIKRMQHLITENHQTKQLNKFLNEKLATLEREKTAPLYQHSMFVGQQQQQQQQMLAQSGFMMPPQSLLQQQSALPPHGVVTGVPVNSSHLNLAGPSTSSTPTALTSTPPLPHSLASLAQQQQQQPLMTHLQHRSSSTGLSSYNNVQLCKPMLYNSQNMLPFPHSGFQYMPQEMLDSSQSDAQLRPPAA